MNKKPNRVQTINFGHHDFKRYTSLNKRNNQNLIQKNPVETTDSNDSTPTRLKRAPFAKNKQLNRYGSQKELKELVFQRQNYKKIKINKQINCQAEVDFKQLTFLPLNQHKKLFQKVGSNPVIRRKTQQSARESRNREFDDSIKQSNPQKTKNLQQTTTSNSSTQDKAKKHKHIPSFFKIKRSSQDCKAQALTIKDFSKIKKLGEGKFGQVYLVREKKTNFIMAMKILEKQKLIKSNFMEQFIRQLKVQAYLNHPNIIKLYGFFHDDNYIYVLLQNACDGQLYKLFQQKKVLSEGTTSYIVKSLLEGVNYMHQNRILHRDIKPQNIVLSHGTVKICDFGWAVHNKSDLRNTYCGTPLYFSPQLLKGRLYDEKVDVWAIGIMAFQLHLGRSPFDICQEEDLYKIITDPIRFPIKQTSAKYRQFVSAILQKNPYHRLSCDRLLQLSFITYYQDLQVYSELI